MYHIEKGDYVNKYQRYENNPISAFIYKSLHNDEKGNIIRDYPENFYDYFHANGVNIEAVKFHIDGGDYNGRDNVEFYRNYVNEVRDITRDFVGKNDVHAIFILNEWYEPTDEGNKDMCNITRSLISDIKAWGI